MDTPIVLMVRTSRAAPLYPLVSAEHPQFFAWSMSMESFRMDDKTLGPSSRLTDLLKGQLCTSLHESWYSSYHRQRRTKARIIE
jgi:hypothetical protein